MRRFLFPTTSLLITIISIVFFSAQNANADISMAAAQLNKNSATAATGQDWDQYLGDNLIGAVNKITFDSKILGTNSGATLQVRICKQPFGLPVQYCLGSVDTVLYSKILFDSSNPVPAGERDVFVERTVTLDNSPVL